MRRLFQFLLVAAVLVLGGATAFLYSRYTQSESSNVSLRADNQNTRNQYAQTINAIAEIQDSLDAIAPAGAKISMEPSTLQTERDMGGPDAKQALERIGVLRASIQRSKARIERLENELRSSGIKVSGLQRMVANLKASTAEKEQQIAQLSTQVGELQTQVTGLSTQVAETQQVVREREETITQKQSELATVYYVADTKSALAKSGVIVAQGGLLGIGKTIKPSTSADPSVFKPLNTDQETVLPLESAKAQVVTAQPASSYELRLVNGRMELHILDPEQFRKVRQLVIVTA